MKKRKGETTLKFDDEKGKKRIGKGETTVLRSRNLKRKLNVTLKEGDDIKGNLIKVSEEDITLEWTAREPKPVGKGKVTVKKNKLIAFDEIKKAKLVVEFNKI